MINLSFDNNNSWE